MLYYYYIILYYIILFSTLGKVAGRAIYLYYIIITAEIHTKLSEIKSSKYLLWIAHQCQSLLSTITPFSLCQCHSICGRVQDGKTALYWAVDKGLFHVTKLLLDTSANTEIANKVP